MDVKRKDVFKEDYRIVHPDLLRCVEEYYLETMQRQAMQRDVDIEPYNLDQEAGLEISGTRQEEVKEMLQFVKDVVRNMKVEHTQLEDGDYFFTDEGKKRMEKLEHRHHVVLKVDDKLVDTVRTAKTTPQEETTIYRWTFPDNKQLFICRGRGEDTGACVVTDAFETTKDIDFKEQSKNKKAFVQFPVPNSNKPVQRKRLRKLVFDLFERFCEDGLETFAIEVDSCQSWPLEDFTEVVLSSFIDYYLSECCPRGFQLYLCVTRGTSEEVLKCLNKTFIDKAVDDFLFKQINEPIVKNNKKMKIEVLQGDICQIQADMIVNTTLRDLDLERGGASKALFRAAGYELQRELRTRYKHGLDYGEITVTRGYFLPCRYVLHGVLNKYDEKTCGQTYKTAEEFYKTSVHVFMIDCLREAERFDCSTISFPVIGNDSLFYPIYIVAEQMFETIQGYEFNSKLQSVNIVIFGNDKEVLQMFQDLKRKHDTTHREEQFPEQNKMQKAKLLKIAGTDKGIKAAREELSKIVKEGEQGKTDDCSPRLQLGQKLTEEPENNAGAKNKSFHGKSSSRSLRILSTSKHPMETSCSSVTTPTRPDELGRSRNANDMFQKQSEAIVLHGFPNYPGFVANSAEKIEKLQSMTVDVHTYDRGNIHKHADELSKGDVLCFVDKSAREITNHGNSYDKIANTAHQLKTRLGIIQETDRRNRSFPNTTEDSSDGDKQTSLRTNGKNEHTPSAETGGARPKTQNLEKQFSWSSDAEYVEIFQIGKIIVQVYKADIKNLPVDCIVNAANGKLQHGGGIARVISDAAGEKLNQESWDYVKKHGDLKVGTVCHTTAGRLRYKRVIHAVGPNWHDYRPYTNEDVRRCEGDLRNAVFNSIKKAEELGLKSIAIPGISAGIFACPRDLCLKQYSRAVWDYTKQASGDKMVLEVHFVDINKAIVKHIQFIFKEMIVDEEQKRLKEKAENRRNQERKAPQSKRNEQNTQSNKSKEESVYPYLSRKPASGQSESEFVCVVSPKLSLYVYTAEMFDIMRHVDIFACVEKVHGKVAGTVSESIEKWCGTNFTDAKLRKMKSAKEGDVILIPGSATTIKFVAFVILYQKKNTKNDEDRQQKMADIYKKLFMEAKKWNCKQLALLLVGTGKSKLKTGYATERLCEGLLAFSKGNPSYELAVHLINTDSKKTNKSVKTVTTLVDKMHKNVTLGNPKETSYPANTDVQKMGQPDKDRFTNQLKENICDQWESDDAKEDDVKVKEGTSPGTYKPDSCVICMETLKHPRRLECGHEFCNDCIEAQFAYKEVCPLCRRVCSLITGDQPEGDMRVTVIKDKSCAGYENYGRIDITYRFLDGKQGPDHPKPGQRYNGITRTSFLPDNKQGKLILEMLKIAFDRKLVFTIGSSRTTGQEGVITWNDIHHKTDPKPNTQFGYPDPTYLDRVTEELAAKGVTEKDVKKAAGK